MTADEQVDAILGRYMRETAAALLLGEDPPPSPLAEILAIREKALSDLLGAV